MLTHKSIYSLYATMSQGMRNLVKSAGVSLTQKDIKDVTQRSL